MIPEGLTDLLAHPNHPLTVAEEDDGVARFVWGELDDDQRAILRMSFEEDRWVFHSLRAQWEGERIFAFLCRILGHYAIEHGVEEFQIVSGERAEGLWEQAGWRQTDHGYVAQTSDVLAYGEAHL